jgi:hypothetical protein
MPTVAQFAETYRCDHRTISRWKNQDAPLSSPKKMRVWLASRKNLPRATRQLLASESTERRAKAVAGFKPLGMEIGSAAALRRLEEAEPLAWARYEAALKAGDSLDAKLALEAWLEINSELRRFDLQVEKSRRNAGELIPRSEAERLTANFVRWFKLAIVGTVNSFAVRFSSATSPADISETLTPALLDQVISTLAILAVSDCELRLPEWFIQAAISPIRDVFSDADEALDARRAAAKELTAEMLKLAAAERARIVKNKEAL